MANYTAVNPLESLQNSNYQFQTLTYPREFDDAASFGHYMNFYINVSKNSKYLGGNGYNTANFDSNLAINSSAWNSTYYSAYGSSFPSGAYTVDPGTTIGGNPGTPNPFGGALGGNAGSITSIPYTRISQAISLYIPDSMNFTEGFDWQEASLTDAGGKLLKGGQITAGGYNGIGDFSSMESLRHIGVLSDIIFGANGTGGLGDIGLGIGGLAVNPQIFMLFRGVDLRTFQFDFVFSPKSSAEAANVRQIIKAFRFHAAPEIDAYSGRYFIPPSIFNIEYMHSPPTTQSGQGEQEGSINHKPNQNIFRMMTLVLQKLAVDYAPFGWSTYKDGMPVQTHLSLVFKETEILTKAKINSGH